MTNYQEPSYRVVAKAVHLETRYYRSKDGKHTSRTLNVSLVSDDGQKFTAYANDINDLHRIGRNVEAAFYLDYDPRVERPYPSPPFISEILPLV